jgi:threonyl-tRNA synthetase
MAQALEEFYPGIKLTWGLQLKMGFIMMLILEIRITDADFKKVEDRVLEISREKHEFKMRSVSKAEALDLYKDNEYKTELILILKTEPSHFVTILHLQICVVVGIFQIQE